ncbi:hypothetical protein B0H13DRAFT_1909771 [Mycena leptocephala]|nr:hypothetical protein B0H13DRAFT_1909771 [Mycena leptocephala]
MNRRRKHGQNDSMEGNRQSGKGGGWGGEGESEGSGGTGDCGRAGAGGGTDAEVDAVIWSGGEWKASDSHGLQMGFVRRAWPVIAPWCNGDGDLEAQWVGTRKYIWEQCFKSTGHRARIEMETDDEETKRKWRVHKGKGQTCTKNRGGSHQRMIFRSVDTSTSAKDPDKIGADFFVFWFTQHIGYCSYFKNKNIVVGKAVHNDA